MLALLSNHNQEKCCDIVFLAFHVRRIESSALVILFQLRDEIAKSRDDSPYIHATSVVVGCVWNRMVRLSSLKDH